MTDLLTNKWSQNAIDNNKSNEKLKLIYAKFDFVSAIIEWAESVHMNTSFTNEMSLNSLMMSAHGNQIYHYIHAFH